MTDSLIKLSQARQWLAEAKTFKDIRRVRDIAKAAEAYARAAGLGRELQNEAAEIRLLAERKSGEKLTQMEKNPGTRTDGSGSSVKEPPREIPTLASLGIDKKQSAAWQKLAAIAEPQFEQSMAHIIDRGDRLTATGVTREATGLNKPVKATGPLVENEGVEFGFWALPRPLTSGWGSGAVWQRMIAEGLGTPDAAFGVRDNIPAGVTGIDRSTGYEWASLEFPDSHFAFGYWDPPYDHLYKNEGIEIWRTVRRIAILHTHIWPRSWLVGAIRRGMYAITMGPMKQIRCLQVFEKANGRTNP